MLLDGEREGERIWPANENIVASSHEPTAIEGIFIRRVGSFRENSSQDNLSFWVEFVDDFSKLIRF